VNLLLTRACGRAKELASRQSLGANRRHMVRQVMVETVLLALVGGLFGLAVGAGGIRLLAVLGVDQLPMGAQIAFDGRLAFVALLGAVVSGIMVGLPVAWFNLRSHLAIALQSDSRGGTTNHAAQRLRHSFIVRRSPALLAGIFAGVALLLAAIGTYGVLAFAVAQRRREIGVRMALGALPRQIATQFLSLGPRLLAVGAILGVLGAWLAGHAMQTLLFNVPALHLTTLAGTAAVMAVASLVACWLPARRAARVDPLVALRSE